MDSDLITTINTKLKYKIMKEIGVEGRNSKVILANDTQLNADVVVKIVKKSDFIKQEDYFKESKIMYETQHPNICEINCASECDDNIYFSMPFYKNGSLNKKLEEKHLTVAEIIKYSLDFLTGVHYIHAKGLIHFDIKPTNILINNSNKAVLTDFGLSLHTDLNGIAENNFFYNCHRPPEACSTTISLTFHSDIYQSGLTLYRMAVGHKKFEEQKSQFTDIALLFDAIKKGNFPKRDAFPSHIPEKLQKIIIKSLDIDPDKRHKNIIELMNELSQVEDGINWEYNYNEDEAKETLTLDDGKNTNVLEIKKNGEIYLSTYNIENKLTKKIRNKKDWSRKFTSLKDLKKFLKEVLASS